MPHRPTTPFQRLLDRWDRLHPFNAVEIAVLSGPLDVARLAEAVAASMEAAGLLPPAALLPPPVDREREPVQGLDSLAARLLDLQLGGAAVPVRFVAADGPGEREHAVALVWHHALCDGRAAASLLAAVLARYAGPSTPPPPGIPLRLDVPARLWPAALARGLDPGFWRGVGSRGTDYVRMRRSFRPPRLPSVGPAARVALLGGRGDHLDRLLGHARESGVTLNDLLTAALAGALAEAFPERRSEPRRRDLSLAVAADLRRLSPRLSASAGVPLGSFAVHVPEALLEPGASPGSLTAWVAARSRREKRPGRLAASWVETGFGAFVSSLVPSAELEGYVARQFVISGAITNLRLPGEWFPPEVSARILDYRLAVSTGPVAPLVLAATTAAGRLGLTLCWRSDRLGPERVERVASSLGLALGLGDPSR